MAIEIEIPPLSYFESGNPFTGSHGQVFRFHTAKDGDELSAFVWNEDICFELAENKEEKRFAMGEEGRVQMKAWLEEKCRELQEKIV